MEDYVRRRHIEEGFDYVGTPHITKAHVFELSGHLPYYADTMFPPMELENAQYYLKAMNCPMHNLIFRSRGRSYRELPLRFFEFGIGLPVREVRRRPRPDPRARAHPGRLAQLRHPRAGARRDPAPAGLRARPAARLRPRRLLPGAVHPRRRPGQAGQVHRLRRGVGGRHRRCSRRRPRETGLELVPDPGGAAFYGPKISVQARDAIGRTWQMSTIQYDFNQPARFGLEYTAADGVAPAAGDDPLGEVRVDRAVLRRPHRALRRRLPGLAGAGAGGRHPDHRRAGALPDRRRAAAEGRRASGSRSTTPTTGCRRRSAPRASRRSRSCCSPAPPTPRPGAVSFRYRDGIAAQRRPGRRGGRADRRLDRRPVTTSTRRAEESARPRMAGSTGRLPGAVSDDDGGPATVFEHLWTPYRMAYIRGEGKPTGDHDCPFCLIPTMSDEDGLIVARGDDGLRRAQPVPVQRRPPDARPVPARARLHRPHASTRSPSSAPSPRRRCASSARSAARTGSTSA